MARQFEKISKEQWEKDVTDLHFIGAKHPDYNDIQFPKRATSKSAGYDLYSPIDACLMPGEQRMIPSGLKVQMDDDDVMLIIIRSSLGIKKGLSIPNQVGVIDADYYNNEDNEGHFWICLKNNTDKQYDIKAGDRLSQAIFIKYGKVYNDEPIKETRGGGFGSTN